MAAVSADDLLPNIPNSDISGMLQLLTKVMEARRDTSIFMDTAPDRSGTAPSSDAANIANLAAVKAVLTATTATTYAVPTASTSAAPDPTAALFTTVSAPTNKRRKTTLIDLIPTPVTTNNKDKTSWTRVSKYFNDHHVNYLRATSVRDGVSIQTANENDYRHMYKTLETIKAPFHTYKLRSEKSLRVVIRGVIQELTDEQITADLIQKDYRPIKITRLHGRDNRAAPLVMVELDKIYKSIFNLQECCGLTVTVESKNIQAGRRQCHKCQLFGHTQPNCHASYRCMKCAGPHSTHLCDKPTTTPAKCANCGGEHLSNALDCPHNPNKNLTRPEPPAQTRPHRLTPLARSTAFSYSSALRGTQTQTPAPQAAAAAPTPSTTTFASVIG